MHLLEIESRAVLEGVQNYQEKQWSTFLSSSDTKLSFSSKGGIVLSDFSSKIRFEIFKNF